MAKQDLVVKLLLDSGAFGNDLRQAERKAKEFGDKMKSAGDTVGSLGKEVGISTGALGKLGSMLGAGGAVVAAVGAFKSVMESTSGTAVEFQSTIAGFQGVLDTFQTSLATFDFSNFSEGLLTVFRNAKNARKAIADMNFGDIAYKYLSGGYKTDLKKYKDEFTSTETTEGRKEELTTLTNETLKDWDTYLKKQKTNIITAFRQKMKDKDNDLDIGAISVELAEQWMKEAAKIRTDPDATKEWKKRVKDINKDINKNNRQSEWNGWLAGRGFISGDTKADFNEKKDAADETKKELIEANQKDLFINEILEMNEKELTEAINQLDKINSLTQDYLNTKSEIGATVKTTTTTKTTKTTGGGSTGGSTGGSDIIIPNPKIKSQLEAAIRQQTQLKAEAESGSEAWWKATNALAEYTKQLEKLLLLEAKLEHPMEPLPEISNILPPLKIEAPDMGLALPKGYKREGGLIVKDVKAPDINVDKIVDELDTMNAALSSSIMLVNGLGAAFASCEDETAQQLAGVSDIVGSVMAGIMSLTQIQQSAIATNNAYALSVATGQAASLPFPANLAAIATVVGTLISVFATIKQMSNNKFAEGGIVGGTSYSGDKLFAMVNSGEMILNKRQQRNLSNMIGGGGGHVEFHISGDSLVGVLNNKRNKTNLTR